MLAGKMKPQNPARNHEKALLTLPVVVLAAAFAACSAAPEGRDPFAGLWAFWSNGVSGTEAYCAVEKTGDAYLVLMIDLKNPRANRKGTAVRVGKELKVYYPDLQASYFLSLLDGRELRIRMVKPVQAEDVTFVYYRAAETNLKDESGGGKS